MTQFCPTTNQQDRCHAVFPSGGLGDSLGVSGASGVAGSSVEHRVATDSSATVKPKLFGFFGQSDREANRQSTNKTYNCFCLQNWLIQEDLA